MNSSDMATNITNMATNVTNMATNVSNMATNVSMTLPSSLPVLALPPTLLLGLVLLFYIPVGDID